VLSVLMLTWANNAMLMRRKKVIKKDNFFILQGFARLIKKTLNTGNSS
jgi:hypothetical protein